MEKLMFEPMWISPQTRRHMLKVLACSVLATLVPGMPSWAQDTQALPPHPAQAALQRILFLLAPSKRFEGAHYDRQAARLVARMRREAAFAATIEAGLTRLHAAADGDFLRAEAPQQIAALRAQNGSPFLSALANPAVGVYNNPAVWPLIGYEGSAFEKGGYIARGVGDIAWLPK
jgi:hypothetical protein